MTYRPVPINETTGAVETQDEGTQQLLEELIELMEKVFVQLTLITDVDLDEI